MTKFGRAMLDLWHLDPAVTYLNHGTVGAVPKRVLAAQRAIQDEIERNPARFLLRELTEVRVGVPTGKQPRMRALADQVAPFFAARGEDLLFVDNATTGANAVLRSLRLAEGDEILVTDHGYGGVTNAARFVAREAGASLRTVALPDPISRPADVVDAIVSALAVAPGRVRLAVIDHIAADSSLIFPVRAIADACHARGVPVLVDGAHAPGAIALDIPSLGADWYVGNLHKWLWAPRASAVLWVSETRRAGLHPTVISWGLDLGASAEFDLVGTRDPSAYLAVPAALELRRELGGEEAIRGYNHALVWQAARALTERWGTSYVVPESMVGPMATVPVPGGLGSTVDDASRLKDALLFEDSIELNVKAIHGGLRVRLAAQIYNEMADFERLGDAIARRAH
jgi:isopenicillin-N epimerase